MHFLQRNTEKYEVFSPNVGEYGPEKLRMRTLFTPCEIQKVKENLHVTLTLPVQLNLSL